MFLNYLDLIGELEFRNSKELVKITVWHEIAHHFGFDEKQVRKLEKKWKKTGKV